MTKKITISVDDPEVRKIWETALEARREVASWPAWKRGNIAVQTDDDGSTGGSGSEND